MFYVTHLHLKTNFKPMMFQQDGRWLVGQRATLRMSHSTVCQPLLRKLTAWHVLDHWSFLASRSLKTWSRKCARRRRSRSPHTKWLFRSPMGLLQSKSHCWTIGERTKTFLQQSSSSLWRTTTRNTTPMGSNVVLKHRQLRPRKHQAKNQRLRLLSKVWTMKPKWQTSFLKQIYFQQAFMRWFGLFVFFVLVSQLFFCLVRIQLCFYQAGAQLWQLPLDHWFATGDCVFGARWEGYQKKRFCGSWSGRTLRVWLWRVCWGSRSERHHVWHCREMAELQGREWQWPADCWGWQEIGWPCAHSWSLWEGSLFGWFCTLCSFMFFIC